METIKKGWEVRIDGQDATVVTVARDEVLVRYADDTTQWVPMSDVVTSW